MRSAFETFAISPDMANFLDSNVTSHGDDRVFNDLISAMDTFGIRNLTYDNQTLTASEAFEQRRGNCLTFTSMFVVMARRVGLDARYQEVRIPPDWLKQGNTMVLRRHVNVYIHLTGKGMTMEGKGERVVDFDDEANPSGFIDSVISDERALAHFYNNWAVESLENGNSELAFAYLRKALQEGDSNFVPAWNLVGVLYQRAGRLDMAEQAYLRALQAEPGETFVMSNLQRLYERQGRTELSNQYNRLVLRHRLKNPYYRLAEARKAYTAGNYRTAIEHLRKAIKLKSDESEFYFLLRDSYVGNGDIRKAMDNDAKGKILAAKNDQITEGGHDNRGRRLVKPKEGI
jgi:Flp pilus assembly protein TadD